MKLIGYISLVLLSLVLTARAIDTCVAIKPHASSVPGTSEMWARRGTLWPQRAVLRVAFLDGSASQQRRAWIRFQAVDKLVNLSFVKVPIGQTSEIRVAFLPDGGHWSYVGTDCAHIPQTRQTMNLALGFWDGSAEWTRVATHEVLHAIGFQHEHQSPQSQIPWNIPAVIADYKRTQGWTEQEIRFQVINREDVPDFIGSAWDRASLMQYPVAKEHVLDPSFAVGWNRKLTETDVATLKRIYP